MDASNNLAPRAVNRGGTTPNAWHPLTIPTGRERALLMLLIPDAFVKTRGVPVTRRLGFGMCANEHKLSYDKYYTC